jgi:Zn finger protein HypA/HybF involved in hydrogenase expression
MKKKQIYTESDLIDATKKSLSYTQVIKRLGIPYCGSTHSRIKKEISNLNIDISHFTGMLWSKGKTLLDDDRLSERNKNEIFIENSKFSKSYIRNLIKKKNLIEYKCTLCSNLGVWNDKKLNLQLDHINGISTDQRLENLRFLCPNCHSQTDTFCAKNIKFTSIKKIDDDELIDMYHKCKGNINRTLKNLGIENGRNYSRVYKLIESKILNG